MANSDPMGLQGAYGLKGMDDSIEKLLARRVAESIRRDQQKQQQISNERADRAMGVQEGYLQNARSSADYARTQDERAREAEQAKQAEMLAFLGTLPEHVRPAAEARRFGLNLSPSDLQRPVDPEEARRQGLEDFEARARITAKFRPIARAPQEPLIRVPDEDEDGQPVYRYLPRNEVAGRSFRLGPTADMRNKEHGKAAAGRAVDAVRTLGESIITRVGPAQRADAIKRGVGAVFGNDPEFRAYEDSRMALAGTLAVEQQGSRVSDADVKALWLPMVPDAYRDTAESYALKWKLIDAMRGKGDDGAASGSAPGGRPQPKFKILSVK